MYVHLCMCVCLSLSPLPQILLFRAKQDLEKTLLEARMSQEHLIVAHQDVQTLIFRIKPNDFRGLNISSDMLMVSISLPAV